VVDRNFVVDSAPTAPGAGAEAAGLVVVPGYVIMRVLGRGGMGVVYLARHLRLKRLVALKMVLAGSHAGPAELVRFRTEAEVVARLHHPNIVQIYEVGEHQGQPYCALEFVAGGSLGRKTAGTPLPARQAAQLIETLARAIHAAHQAGIVHRDLKPANILLEPSGPGDGLGVPKITDFGLARKLDDSTGPTNTGAVMGTPSYMAPEQATGKGKEAGPAADIYALGAILYELLTGRPPFKGETQLDTLLQVVSNEPVQPSHLLPRVPRDLETICLKCLQKQDSRRYASGEELADDLRRFLNTEPIRARPSGVGERLVKWARRRPTAAALVAVTIFAACALLGGGLSYHLRLEKALRDSEEQRKAAIFAKGLADDQRTEAQKQRGTAETERARAVEGELAARRYLYAAHIKLAQEAWEAERPARARELLDGLRARSGQVDLRGFEWYHLWRLCNGDRFTIPKHPDFVRQVLFAPGGEALVSVGGNVARVWDLASGKELPPLPGCTRGLDIVQFSPDGNTLAVGGTDGTIGLWDRATGQAKGTLRGHRGTVHALCFANGTTLASGGADGTVRIWDLTAQKEIGVLHGHQGAVYRTVIGPDGNTLATTSADRSLKLWDIEGKKLRSSFAEPDGCYFTSLVFGPDKQTMITGEGYPFNMLHEGRARVRDLDGKVRSAFPMPAGGVFAVALSGDGKTLATGGNTGAIYLWDLATGEKRGRLLGHADRLHALAFGPDGKTLASGGNDNTAKLWNLKEPPEPFSIAALPGGTILSVAFSPDG
jgi:hypothetical protein